MTPLSIFLLTMGSFATTQHNDTPLVSESSEQNPPFISKFNGKIHHVFRTISQEALYLTAAEFLRSASLLARVGWGVCQMTPWASTVGNECSLLSHTWNSASMRLFTQLFKGLPSFLNGIPLSHSSWHLNKQLLSQVPAFSNEEKQLIRFLEKRWLAKSTGFYPILIDWVCPCYGIFVQVDPKTTNSYARDPSNKLSQVYSDTVLQWKQALPHPQEFPLILTRPKGIQEYLPSYLEVCHGEMITDTMARLTSMIQTPDSKVYGAQEGFANFDQARRGQIELHEEHHSRAAKGDEKARFGKAAAGQNSQNLTERRIIVDLTQIFKEDLKEPKQWLQAWNAYAAKLSKICKECHVDPNQILWIQRIEQKGIAGIRILPLDGLSTHQIDQHYQYLLKWISKFGLSANRIELDRLNLETAVGDGKVMQDFDSELLTKGGSHSPMAKGPPLVSDSGSKGCVNLPSPTAVSRLNLETAVGDGKLTQDFPSPTAKEEFINYLISFDDNLYPENPQKTLMLKGTLQVLRGLFAHLSEDRWVEILHNPTRSSIVEYSFAEIKKHFKLIAEKKEEFNFYEVASHLEQIHAHLTALLEIFSPFISDDFPSIYQDLLTSIPQNLKQHITCGIHSSGMTSLASIFKAMKEPRVLYGENTYFEIIEIAESISNATPIDAATEEDWKEVDLILAQFNPVLKRIDFEVTGYQVEKIADALRKSLKTREGKPLTVALDSTLDYINSPKANQLLVEFQDEIEKGNLNIICYRSGLKFNLFGMDNYCGAPFYMIHNQDVKWASFEGLLKDAALQTDHLSLNWFCLAYKYAAPQLDQYLKQVFENTRAALNKMPSRVFKNTTNYRVIPVEKEAEAGFIDIKIFGPLHQMRASLIGGYLTLKFLEKKHPIFYRPSIGFYHPNFNILFSPKCSTIRLTLGLDPTQVHLLAECFEVIDSLNGKL